MPPPSPSSRRVPPPTGPRRTPCVEPGLPPAERAAARAAQIRRLRVRLAAGDYALSPRAIAEALIAIGCATGELAVGVPAARRDAAATLVADAIARLSPPAAMGLQLSLVEHLPDSAIAPLLGTARDQLEVDRKQAFAALRQRLGG